jgi:hypothetical protein
MIRIHRSSRSHSSTFIGPRLPHRITLYHDAATTVIPSHQHFNEVYSNGKVVRRKCKHCPRVFAATTSTSILLYVACTNISTNMHYCIDSSRLLSRLRRLSRLEPFTQLSRLLRNTALKALHPDHRALQFGPGAKR